MCSVLPIYSFCMRENRNFGSRWNVLNLARTDHDFSNSAILQHRIRPKSNSVVSTTFGETFENLAAIQTMNCVALLAYRSVSIAGSIPVYVIDSVNRITNSSEIIMHHPCHFMHNFIYQNESNSLSGKHTERSTRLREDIGIRA